MKTQGKPNRCTKHSPPFQTLGKDQEDEVGDEPSPDEHFVLDDLVGVVVVQTEEANANGDEEGTGRGDVREDVRVMLRRTKRAMSASEGGKRDEPRYLTHLDDALHRAEGVQRKAVLLGVGHRDEQDDADVLEQEDGGGDQHGSDGRSIVQVGGRRRIFMMQRLLR